MRPPVEFPTMRRLSTEFDMHSIRKCDIIMHLLVDFVGSGW